MSRLIALYRDESGATAVEYAVMLAMILLVVIGAISAFGQGQAGMWTNIGSEMSSHGL